MTPERRQEILAWLEGGIYMYGDGSARNDGADQIIRELLAELDRRGRIIKLLIDGWDVHRASLYDEEGVPGWLWVSPSGTEYAEIGDDDIPVIPNPLTVDEAVERIRNQPGVSMVDALDALSQLRRHDQS